MSFDSPAKASNASTPTRPRTRSQCSREDFGQIPERPDFSVSSGDYRDDDGLPSSFVQGKLAKNDAILILDFFCRHCVSISVR